MTKTPLPRFCWMFLALAAPSFAGQSLQIAGGGTTSYPGVPLFSPGTPVRVEFMLHDWTDYTDIFGQDGFGIEAVTLTGEGGTAVVVKNAYVGDQAQIYLVPGPTNDPALSSKRAYFRIQYDPAAKTAAWEAWDVNGLRFFNSIKTYTSALKTAGHAGLLIGDYSSGIAGPARALAFFRVYNTLVANNSRVPVTADTSPSVINLKFEGNLKDSSGHGYNGTVSSGSVSYVNTPDQNVQAVVRLAGAPFWTNTATTRAGFPARLDANNSYTQSDASSAISCSWDVAPDAPSNPAWDNRTSCTPTITGLVFGDYPIQLTVTDSTGMQATLTQHIGAVAMDSKGIVINGNPNVDTLFGPMIAYGRNPWGFVDERQMRSMNLRNAYYQDSARGHLGNPTWETAGAGTVTYYVNGKGNDGISAAGTTLNGGITETAITITVADATVLDFTELPTRIVINNAEEVRICSVAGNVLTVCYDGRGAGFPGIAAADGAGVGQRIVKGAGTQFITDPNTAVCPSGAPGWPGQLVYNTGTVTLTPGSGALTGTGTVWNGANGINTPSNDNTATHIRINATHGGLPFVFLAAVQTIADTTHIVMNRPFPADADAGVYSYSFIWGNQHDIRSALHYTRPTDGSDAKFADYLTGCESETSFFRGAPSHDFGFTQPGLNGSLQSGKQYSIVYAQDQGNYLNSGSGGGINFYGVGMGDRSLYYRSGIKLAETTANMIDDNWIKSPSVAGHDVGGIDLFLGGGVIGAVADAVLNPSRVNWADIRGFARYAKYQFESSLAASQCLGPRESGYFSAWLNLAGLYDPDVTQRAVWNTVITNSEIPYENACKNSDVSGTHPERVNSWASPLIPEGSPLVGLTNSSTAGTFPRASVDICRNIANGTAAATNHSTALTGTGFVASPEYKQIVLTGAKNGQPYTQYFLFNYISSTSIALWDVWPGDSGAVDYIMIGDQNQLTFGTSATDPQFYEPYACTYNSGAGTFTLNRPWTGATSPNTNVAAVYNLSGFGTQPYMMGIKNTGFEFGAALSDSTAAAAFSAFAAAASTWVHDYGYDPRGHYLHYGRVFGACEPDPESAPGCNGAASLNAEAQSTLRSFYQANPTPANQLYGDQFYAANWGNPAYTTGGAATDPGYNTFFTQDQYMAGPKWPGFYFGMGMAHQWPAVRLGGVDPEQSRSFPVFFDLASVANATEVTIKVVAPSGAISNTTCRISPCMVKVDARQGQHLVQRQYKSAVGVVIETTKPEIVTPDQPNYTRPEKPEATHVSLGSIR